MQLECRRHTRKRVWEINLCVASSLHNSKPGTVFFFIVIAFHIPYIPCKVYYIQLNTYARWSHFKAYEIKLRSVLICATCVTLILLPFFSLNHNRSKAQQLKRAKYLRRTLQLPSSPCAQVSVPQPNCTHE